MGCAGPAHGVPGSCFRGTGVGRGHGHRPPRPPLPRPVRWLLLPPANPRALGCSDPCPRVPYWGRGWWPRRDVGRSSPRPTPAPWSPGSPARRTWGNLGHPGLARPSHAPAELPPSRHGAGRGKGNRCLRPGCLHPGEGARHRRVSPLPGQVKSPLHRNAEDGSGVLVGSTGCLDAPRGCRCHHPCHRCAPCRGLCSWGRGVRHRRHRGPAGPGGVGGCSNPFPWLCSLHRPGLGSGNRCRPGQWQRQWPPCWAVPGPGQAEVEPWSPLAPGQLASGPAWPCPCPAWGHGSCLKGTGAGRRRDTGSLPEPLPGFGRAWLWGCGGRGRSWGWALLAWPRRGFAFHR